MYLNKSIIACLLLCTSVFACSCKDEPNKTDENKTETEEYVLPELKDPVDLHKGVKSILGFSPYIDLHTMESQGYIYDGIFTSKRWDDFIEMVATKFNPYGYEYIITDGFISQTATDETGYMTKYGDFLLSDLVARCKAKGLKLGVYDNPFWLKRTDNTCFAGTNYSFASLLRNESDVVQYPKGPYSCQWITHVVTDHPGAKEFFDGWFKHKKDLGVDYVFLDFNDFYEDGWDPGRQQVQTAGFGRERYERGLSYMAEAAQKYGVLTTCGLSWHRNDSELEAKYFNFMRTDRDTGFGGWDHISKTGNGKPTHDTWIFDYSQIDGFTACSHLTGRDKIRLNGDFILLSACKSDGERRFTISISLMAGGPIIIGDTPERISGYEHFYTNQEMLALNYDGFVGKPLDDTPRSAGSNIWYGEMTDGDIVVAFFNRESEKKLYELNLADIGYTGTYKVRDLWEHRDKSDTKGSLAYTVNPHDVIVLRLTKSN